jgi:nucleoside-diphosphate-sugar epimerase
MRVFVTGATGFIGSAVVRELLDGGHQVVGLARSVQSAEALKAVGVTPHRGDLEDLDSLRAAAVDTDGVIHTAYDHSFVDFAAAALKDRRAIEAMAEAMVGTHKPLLITSGVGGLTQGRPATEADLGPPGAGRVANEQLALSFVEQGVRSVVVRFPSSVHGRGDHGFVPILINVARQRGFSAYPGDGANRWAAVHRLDAAHLFCLALQRALPGVRLHGMGDGGIPVKEIAEVIARHLGLPVRSIAPEEAMDHFGFLGRFFAMDIPASSAATRGWMGWYPAQPGLIEDLEAGHYFEQAEALPAAS